DTLRGRDALASASGVALGVKIGEVHAATAAFFAAFCRALPPCGLRVGARAFLIVDPVAAMFYHLL
ncbi:MAG TPA: hypothetical protein P5330_12430, partial [Candidatus Competibacteraceae bacterium]|nr:hypothetical protein [Candidatus Competibacteraceae bacterium]